MQSEVSNDEDDFSDDEETKNMKDTMKKEQEELNDENDDTTDNNLVQTGGADSIQVKDKGIVNYTFFPGSEVNVFDEPFSAVLNARTYNQNSIMYELYALLSFIKNEQTSKTNFISENFTSIEIIIITLNILDMFEKMSGEISLSDEIKEETKKILKGFNVKNEGKVQAGGSGNNSNNSNNSQNSENNINMNSQIKQRLERYKQERSEEIEVKQKQS